MGSVSTENRKDPVVACGGQTLLRALVVTAILALSLWPSHSRAGEFLGADLERFCNSGDERDLAICRFYTLGVVQGAGLAAGLAKDKTHFCIPDDLSQDEIAAIVTVVLVRDFVAYPDDRKLPAAGLVGGAIAHRFPCK